MHASRKLIINVIINTINSFLKPMGCLDSCSPLRIAFFGTDSFALQSLRALNAYRLKNGSHIASLNLITRPPKLAGRGLNSFKDAETAQFATEHGIDVLRAETEQEIENLANRDYNLAVAVSYGRLIPAKFLQGLKYGGLNVHPSLLPELRGAAPIHWALLKGFSRTGVSVQTLHPTKFDHGKILCQSAEMQINASDDTVTTLRDKLGVVGSKLLTRVISDQLYDPKNRHCISLSNAYTPSYARKILPSDNHVFLLRHTVRSVLTKNKVLGRLTLRQEIDGQEKRVFIDSLADATQNLGLYSSLQLGEFYPDSDGFYIRLLDGLIKSPTLMLQGYKAQDPASFEKSRRKRKILTNQFIIS